MSTLRIKFSIFINYFLFAILLNSVGTVILQVQHYFGASESAASVLEPFKDLSIAITSFLVASFITRIGYKKSMLFALGFVALGCFIIPMVQSFIAVKLLFAITGASFALTKVSVYGTIGLITKDNKEHISLMSFIESFFMVGIFAGYFIFSGFIDDKNPLSPHWFNVYYLLGALSVIAFLLLLASPLDESAAQVEKAVPLSEDISGMLKLIILPVVISFLVCAFVYVLIEQSIMSWLPTFNNKVLKLPSTISVQMASVLAGSYALGRFFAGVVLKKFRWYVVLTFCLVGAAILVVLALPLAGNAGAKPITGWGDVPFAAFIFPLIGLLLAPIYPAINSVILASLPKSKHGFMSGLIVVFSALGGTLGSVITGFIFQYYGGKTAFYFSIVPMTILAIALFLFEKMKNKTLVGQPKVDSAIS